MSNGDAMERETAVTVGRGLYLLRYISEPSSPASPAPVSLAPTSPVAVVRPAPGFEARVQIVSPPGAIAGFLSGPGACAVLRVEQAASLLIKVVRQNYGASLDAAFRIESIGGDGLPDALVTVSGAAEAGALSDPADVSNVPLVVQIALVAHVARRGDVEVGAGSWIAGPESPAAIEGVEIRGQAHPGLRIEMQALVLTRPAPRWLDWVPQGVFAGSRGRSLPLGGLRLRLVGEAADRFALVADALFLGSPILSKRGRDLELVSAAGADSLVGLRLAIQPEQASSVSGFVAAARREPRVRVFRATTG